MLNDSSHLWLYFAVVMGVVMLPGLDMAFVLSSTLTGGRQRGLSAVAGIVVGGAVHVLVAATGLATLLKVAPAVFNGLLWAGALYVGWIGLSVFRSEGGLSEGNTETFSPAATFRRGVVTCLLNPKAYLFMLAIFPRFLRPEQGSLAAQTMVLWLICAFSQTLIYGSIALAGSPLHHWFASSKRASAMVSRAVGVLLMATALITAFESWRSVTETRGADDAATAPNVRDGGRGNASSMRPSSGRLRSARCRDAIGSLAPWSGQANVLSLEVIDQRHR